MSDKFDPFGELKSLRRGWAIGTKLNRAISNHFRGRREDAERQSKEAEVTRHNDSIVNAPPPLHGSARWPGEHEVRQAGLLHGDYGSPPAGRSIRVGAMTSALSGDLPVHGILEWDADGHIMTLAPTRSGKATSLIVPNLLSYRGSTIVLDPKGELFELTSAWRKTLGPVYRIALFDRDDRKAAGYPRHQFNPLRAVRSPGDARALAELLLPKDPKASAFFQKDAASFLTAAIIYLLDTAPHHARTIRELRRLTTLSLNDFKTLIRRMQESPVPQVREGANVVTFKAADRGLPSLIETLNSDLALWNEPDVVHAVGGTDIDFEELKNTPGTVYVTVPFDRLSPYAPFIKVLLQSALDAMVQNPVVPRIPVLFVLDEFLALEDATQLLKAIRTHAGAGVRLWFILQDFASLRSQYGDAGEVVFNTALKMWFGVNEFVTAERLSKELGTGTRAHEKLSFTISQSTSKGGDPFTPRTQNHSVSVQRHVDLMARPLATPEEIRNQLSKILSDRTRLGITQVDEFVGIPTRLIPYFRVPWCRERAGCIVPVVESSEVARYLREMRP